jgi:hypothetical protein
VTGLNAGAGIGVGGGAGASAASAAGNVTGSIKSSISNQPSVTSQLSEGRTGASELANATATDGSEKHHRGMQVASLSHVLSVLSVECAHVCMFVRARARVCVCVCVCVCGEWRGVNTCALHASSLKSLQPKSCVCSMLRCLLVSFAACWYRFPCSEILSFLLALAHGRTCGWEGAATPCASTCERLVKDRIHVHARIRIRMHTYAHAYACTLTHTRSRRYERVANVFTRHTHGKTSKQQVNPSGRAGRRHYTPHSTSLEPQLLHRIVACACACACA